MDSPGPSAWGKEDPIFDAMYNIPRNKLTKENSKENNEDLTRKDNDDKDNGDQGGSKKGSTFSQARVDCWQKQPTQQTTTTTITTTATHNKKGKDQIQAPPRAPKIKKTPSQQPVAASPSTRLFKMTRATPRPSKVYTKKFHHILVGDVKKKLSLDLKMVVVPTSSSSSTSRTTRSSRKSNEVLKRKKNKQLGSQCHRPQSAK